MPLAVDFAASGFATAVRKKPKRFVHAIPRVAAYETNPRDIGLGILPSLSPKGNRVAYCRHPRMGEPDVWIGDVSDLDS